MWGWARIAGAAVWALGLLATTQNAAVAYNLDVGSPGEPPVLGLRMPRFCRFILGQSCVVLIEADSLQIPSKVQPSPWPRI